MANHEDVFCSDHFLVFIKDRRVSLVWLVRDALVVSLINVKRIVSRALCNLRLKLLSSKVLFANLSVVVELRGLLVNGHDLINLDFFEVGVVVDANVLQHVDHRPANHQLLSIVLGVADVLDVEVRIVQVL